MEPKELEKNLAEIEERLDRVRALYEQYFCGIEKIEPQVPRKDLDRRIAAMRKEQLRNTAMRFKFQTLVQRYNTLQQHWGRVVRDIENGTFKRDLARAAARFGVDEALTAVGRKRAERLAKGVEAQAAKLEARTKKQRELAGEDVEEVSDADIEDVDDFDDEAPTPPPLSAQHVASTVGGSAPVGNPSHLPLVFPAVSAAGGFGEVDAVVPAVAAPLREPARPLPNAGAPDAGLPRAKGGLRLGGGPAKRANSEALSRIANSLAPEAPPPPSPEAAASPAPRKPLLSRPLGLEDPPQSSEPKPSEPKPELTRSPAATRPNPSAGALRPPPAAAPPPRTHAESASPAAGARREDLSPDRLREIYSQYVQTRRDRNESTAGITYEKLADSLRAQADKLREKHAAKKVDYEVVVKDGKTLIKPIVR
jgi:hypothetical protein